MYVNINIIGIDAIAKHEYKANSAWNCVKMEITPFFEWFFLQFPISSSHIYILFPTMSVFPSRPPSPSPSPERQLEDM